MPVDPGGQQIQSNQEAAIRGSTFLMIINPFIIRRRHSAMGEGG
jgi:hypothetical protein